MSTWRDSDPDGGRRPAKPVADGLARELRRLGGPDGALTMAVFGHWPEIVGPLLADHCRPHSLRRGVLTVVVDQPAWATQMRYLEATVLERIAAQPGGAEVQELVVRVEGERPRREGR